MADVYLSMPDEEKTKVAGNGGAGPSGRDCAARDRDPWLACSQICSREIGGNDKDYLSPEGLTPPGLWLLCRSSSASATRPAAPSSTASSPTASAASPRPRSAPCPQRLLPPPHCVHQERRSHCGELSPSTVDLVAKLLSCVFLDT
jgi:hypothetical protein